MSGRTEPPVVTLTGLRPPGGIEVAGGTVRIRIIEDAGTVTTEAADPPAPPGNKPLVTVAPQSRWRSGCDRQRRPCTRAHSGSRRHRTAAGRLTAGGIRPSHTACLAPLRAGAVFRPGADGLVRLHPDHRYSRGPFHETAHRRTAHEAACKWDPKGGRPQARGQTGSTHAARAPGCCPSSIPNTRTNVHSAWLIWASAHPNQGQSVCSN